MTSEFGAPSQLEKIDMLDYADIIVVNKFEKKGSDDAIRDIRKQVQRNRKAFDTRPEEFPVYGTIASKFNDDGVTALYHGIIEQLNSKKGCDLKSTIPRPALKTSSSKAIVIPPDRTRYLSEITEAIRKYHRKTADQADKVRRRWHLLETADLLSQEEQENGTQLLDLLKQKAEAIADQLEKETAGLVQSWPKMQQAYSGDDYVYTVRGNELRVPLYTESLSHTRIPKISLPKFKDPGDIFTWLRKENLPGYFPFTGGVFPLKRTNEDPTRMFAGEGGRCRPTGASNCCPKTIRPNGCRPPSIR